MPNSVHIALYEAYKWFQEMICDWVLLCSVGGKRTMNHMLIRWFRLCFKVSPSAKPFIR